MGAGTSLNRALFSLGSGFTVTGLEFTLFYGGLATAAANTISTATPAGPLLLEFGIGYGNSGYSPVNLLGNENAAELWYVEHMSDYTNAFEADVTNQWQFVPSHAWFVRLRSQFRLSSATDFKAYIGNGAASTQSFAFLPMARLFYA